MAYQIVWTVKSSEDIEAIVRYVARENPQAASELGRGIYERVQMLIQFPDAGRVVPEIGQSDWRELIYWKYHVNQRAEAIEIARVWRRCRSMNSPKAAERAHSFLYPRDPWFFVS